MLLRSLQLHNFGRYMGTSTINMSVTDNRNIVLINGSNDRGKTTLLAAIKFALFGEQQNIKADDLINYQQAKLGDGSMYVEIVFEHNNREYRLHRSVEFRQVVVDTERPSSTSPHLSIFEDGHKVDLDQRWLEHLLPMDVSQFFIFDGEQIQEYIKKSATSLQEPIEIILGVRELFHAQTDIKEFLFETERKRERILANISGNNDKYEKLVAKLRGYEDNQKMLKSSIRQAKRDVNKYTAELNNHDELKDLNNQDKKIRNNIKNLEADQEIHDRKVAQQRGSFGLFLLRPLLQLVNEVGSTKVEGWESTAARHVLGRDCCVCGRALDDESTKILNSKTSDSTRVYLHDLVSEISGQSLDIMMDELVSVLRHQADNQNKIDLLNDELGDIRKKIDATADNEFDHDYTVKSLRRAQGDIQRWEVDLRKCQDNIIKTDKRMKDFKKEIEVYANNDRLMNIEKQQDAVKKLHSAVEQVIKDFYGKRKPKLEKMISDVFLRMTNNLELYNKIEIKDDFSIGIVRSNGMSSPTTIYSPSAGMSQVIATAVIFGLSKFAVRDAPIVIDTPLSRLDLIHKINVIKHYSRMGRQVIILYQPNEMSNQDIQIINNNIASEWDITTVPNQPGASVVSLVRSNL